MVIRIRSGFSALQADSLPSEPPRTLLAVARFSSVQSLSRVLLFATPWTAAHQASLSVTNSQNLLKFMSVAYSVIFSRLLSFLVSGSFPMSWFFALGGQNSGASASTSVLPMNRVDFL